MYGDRGGENGSDGDRTDGSEEPARRAAHIASDVGREGGGTWIDTGGQECVKGRGIEDAWRRKERVPARTSKAAVCRGR